MTHAFLNCSFSRLAARLALVLAATVPAATLFAADAQSIARGKYLVQEVAKCSECHTPLADDGKPDMTKFLKGAKLNFAPANPVPGWHATSPDITSTGKIWARWGDDGSVKS